MWKKVVLLFAVFSAFSCGDAGVVNGLPSATPAESGSGAVRPEQRIIGGSFASIEEYPYVVQVWRNNEFTCGGSLLTVRTLLSAARCFVNNNGQLISRRQFSIRAGTIFLSGGQTRSVSNIINHESYNTPHRDNDISIVVLSSPVTLSATVQLAPPLQASAPPDNAAATYVGWGGTSSSVVGSSQFMREVSVNVINQNTCARDYGFLDTVPGMVDGQPYLITDNMICATYRLGGNDACAGDTGGPLISNGRIVGVISWGFQCGNPAYPGVNTRVANYIQWINNTVSINGSTANKASVAMLLALFISALRLTRQ